MSNACLIIIGNEVLSGRTQDLNLSFLGSRLNEIGVRMVETRVIADDTDVIVETVNECRAKFDYVFTTGGIGPTHDDITSAAIAKAFGVELYRDQKIVDLFLQHYKPEELNDERLKMCDFPIGSSLIENPISKAPGYQVGNVFVLAGVPVIMQAMYEALKDRLIGGKPMQSKTVIAYVGEGVLAKGLGEVQNAHASVEIGSYPFFRQGRLGSALVVRGADEEALEAATQAVRDLVSELGVEHHDETNA
jgi:molybdenum cofactor synthesis domain-containing protein